MRIIDTKDITKLISQMVFDAAIVLREDVVVALKKARRLELSARAKDTLDVIVKNAEVAKKRQVPICQDTGMTIVYCEIGRQVVFKGNIDKAINKGVELATKKGCLRHSVVNDPFERENTGTNTPAIVHYKWCSGSKVRVSVLLKGFGSENKGKVLMLNPTASFDEIKSCIVNAVFEAGANACPPYVLGIGMGGTMDKAAEMAKEVLLEPIGQRHTKKWASKLETEVIKGANLLNIGPLGLGGKTTVLDAKVKFSPTHIAGLPVSINISCHALRSRTVVL